MTENTPTPAADKPAGESIPAAAPSAPRPMGDRPQGPGGYRPRPGGPGASRPGQRPTGPGGPMGRGRRPPPRRKVCRFCAEKISEVDYKAIPVLRGFLTARGKMLSGRTTGNCARHQRQLTTAIKRAQNLSLLPYTGE